jgi:hypothetical protein
LKVLLGTAAYLLVFLASAFAISPSQNETIFLSKKITPSPGGGACPRGTTFADGCPGAKTGTIQFSTLLNGYAARPPWNVAGVEYPVGIPSGTTLQSAATATVPAGCSRNSGTHQITCTSGSPTFDSWDFSPGGGWELICNTSGLLTVTNSNFEIGTNALDTLFAASGCGGITATYNSFNGHSLSNTTGGLVQMEFLNGAGTFTFEYNYLTNAFLDVLDIGPTTETIKYNVVYSAGGGNHSDWVQTGSGLYNVDLEFNTINTIAGAGTQGFGLGQNVGGTFASCTMAHNTTISVTGSNIAYHYAVDSTETTGAVTVHDNYVDTTGGAFGLGIASFAKSGSACNPCSAGGTSIFSNNINMVNGTLYTNFP